MNADLSLKIMPLVSSEDMVTLEIEVNQSNFTTRIAQTAPPGSVERKFSSIVRARDRDMIVLGEFRRLGRRLLADLLRFLVQFVVVGALGHAINLLKVWAVKSTMGTTRA